MPLNHLLGRRKRDRLTLNLAVIDARCRKLDNLAPDQQADVDQLSAYILDFLTFAGADTFDRPDLLTLGMGAALMQQAFEKVKPSMQPLVYEVVWTAIKQRIDLIEGKQT